MLKEKKNLTKGWRKEALLSLFNFFIVVRWKLPLFIWNYSWYFCSVRLNVAEWGKHMDLWKYSLSPCSTGSTWVPVWTMPPFAIICQKKKKKKGYEKELNLPDRKLLQVLPSVWYACFITPLLAIISPRWSQNFKRETDFQSRDT